MKNLLMLTSFTFLFACKSNSETPENNTVSNEITANVNSTESEPVPKPTDIFVGRWVNIKKENEIINLEKKYDNVYQLGGLTLYKKYADDGTVYLMGEFEEYGAEVQVIFDNHTQHLILRHPADLREYKKIE